MLDFGVGTVGTAFLLALIVTVAFQLACFCVAFALKFDKITDLAGCSNFIIVAILSLVFSAPQPPTTRQVVITGLVCLSRFQLAAYLLYRVLRRGRDARFDEIRESCPMFFAFWVYQMMWVFIVSVGVIFINSVDGLDEAAAVPIGVADVVGWALFVFGFVLQVWSDMVKQSFRNDSRNAQRVCDVGPWKYSRHPNFCGEVLMWFAVFVAGIPLYASNPAGWATVASPIFTLLILLVVSGIPQAEGNASARWYNGGEEQMQFEAYFHSTPPLWLFPPALYRRMPASLKLVLCFELPMYEYNPH